MTVSPVDFLRSAQIMMNHHEEIDHRNAASRAYMGAYHACRFLRDALELGPLPSILKVEGSHRKLIRTLQQAPVPLKKGAVWAHARRIRQLGQQLKSLRDLQNAAEYRISRNFSRNDARQVVAASREIIRVVDMILREEGDEGDKTDAT
ncbi:MAG: hypothetical protein HQL54_05960 [Magnetococcales bacterium]|nr:hypothetical protein [Magnetococcales bacterium]